MNRLQSVTRAAVLTALAVSSISACGSSGDDASQSGDSTAESGVTSTASVGEVPRRPEAAPALQKWVADLQSGDLDKLVDNCWTIEPERARSMYADKPAILAAVAKPGTDGQFAYVWEDDATRVSVKRSEIASGYACPYVAEKSDLRIYTPADAEYKVVRYLQRIVGEPVNPDDTEKKYPLECAGFAPASRKLAEEIDSYSRQSFLVTGDPAKDLVVTVAVTTAGNQRVFDVHTAIEDEGYCIKSVV